MLFISYKIIDFLRCMNSGKEILAGTLPITEKKSAPATHAGADWKTASRLAGATVAKRVEVAVKALLGPGELRLRGGGPRAVGLDPRGHLPEEPL